MIAQYCNMEEPFTPSLHALGITEEAFHIQVIVKHATLFVHKLLHCPLPNRGLCYIFLTWFWGWGYIYIGNAVYTVYLSAYPLQRSGCACGWNIGQGIVLHSLSVAVANQLLGQTLSRRPALSTFQTPKQCM